MRLTLCYVSFAVFLAEQAQAAPLLGLPSLPVVGQPSQLVDGVAQTLLPVPVAGALIGDLLQSTSSGNLLSTAGLTGDEATTDFNSPSNGESEALQRRQELPLVGNLGGLLSGTPVGPLLGAVTNIIPLTSDSQTDSSPLSGLVNNLPVGGSLSPVTKRDPQFAGLPIVGPVGGLTSGISSVPLLGSLTDMLPVTSVLTGGGRAHATSPLAGLVGALPVSGLLSSLKKREPQSDFLGLGNLFSSIPFVGSFGSGSSPSASSPPSSDSNSSTSTDSPPASGLSGLLSGLFKRETGGGIGSLLDGLPVVGSLGAPHPSTGSSGGSLPIVGGLTSSLPVVGDYQRSNGLLSSLPVVGQHQGSNDLLSSVPLVGGGAGNNGLLSALPVVGGHHAGHAHAQPSSHPTAGAQASGQGLLTSLPVIGGHGGNGITSTLGDISQLLPSF